MARCERFLSDGAATWQSLDFNAPPAPGGSDADWVQPADQRAAVVPGCRCPDRAGGRGAGLRLSDIDRPHRAAEPAGPRLSLFRERRVPRRGARAPARTADDGGLHRCQNLTHRFGAGGDGGAPPAPRARRQIAGDDRRPLRRTARRRHRRGLAPGGVRGCGGDPVCRPRCRDRRISAGVSGALGGRGTPVRRRLGQIRPGHL